MTRGGSARVRAAVLAVATVLALLGHLLVVASTPAAAAGRDDPLRILIIGDSVTQGSAGDWSWRYRLWQHLVASGTAVDLVGPRQDLWDNVAGGPGSPAYADPAFDRDHAARWGATLAFYPDTDADIGGLVTTYRPDVVIEMLGANDLTFLGHSAGEVAEGLRDLVGTVRAADPDVDVVLGRLPQTWYPRVPELNVLMGWLAAELDTAASRVTTADSDVGFTLREDTWDAAHPNARGEVRIAAAMADALAVLGHAPAYPRPPPDVPRGPRAGAVLSVEPEDGAVRLTWDDPPGADHEVVWVRDLTRGGPWTIAAEPVAGGSSEIAGLSNGDTYEVRLQPVKGWWAAEGEVWSNVERVRPLPPPPGPAQVTRAWSPRTDRVRVRGSAVPGATAYRVEAAPTRGCAARRAPFSLVTDGARWPRASLRTPASYVRVRMVASNLAGDGVASAVSCVRVR